MTFWATVPDFPWGAQDVYNEAKLFDRPWTVPGPPVVFAAGRHMVTLKIGGDGLVLRRPCFSRRIPTANRSSG